MTQVHTRSMALGAVLAFALVVTPVPAAAVLSPGPVQQTGVAYRADGVTGDQYGYAVAIDGNTAVVGAPFDDGEEGSVFVYEYNGLGWVFSQRLPADPAAGDHFGAAVDIDGDHIVVGAPLDFAAGIQRGTAIVFERTPSGWAYLSELVPPRPWRGTDSALRSRSTGPPSWSARRGMTPWPRMRARSISSRRAARH